MERVLSELHSDAEYVLHLGDGAKELERLGNRFPRIAAVGVLGNCDWGFGYSEADKQRILDIEGVRIFLCHGHRYGVRSGDTDALAYAASARNADIALYGHTHCSEYKTVCMSDGGKTLHIMNPGSISRPRGGEVSGPSYGVILLYGGGKFDMSLCSYTDYFDEL